MEQPVSPKFKLDDIVICSFSLEWFKAGTGSRFVQGKIVEAYYENQKWQYGVRSESYGGMAGRFAEEQLTNCSL